MSISNKIIKQILFVVITGSPAFQVFCQVECCLNPLPVEMQIANIYICYFPAGRFVYSLSQYGPT